MHTLPFKSDKNHYTADACVVWCFDDRFSQLYHEHTKTAGLARVDLVKVAGGAKGLAMPSGDPEHAFVLDQIAKSIKLHHTPKVVLMMHSECGAYGGTSDETFYTEELKKARASIAQHFPTIAVQTVFADFDGLKEVAQKDIS